MPRFSITKTQLIAGSLCLAFIFSCHFAAGVFGATGEASKDIDALNTTLKKKQSELDKIRNKQTELQKAIQRKQSERATLQNQLSLVDNRMAEAQLALDQVKIDIETTNLEIQKTGLEINEQDKQINDNKDHLASALRLLSQEDDKSQLEILLLNDYLTQYVSEIKYLENINDKISGGLTNLRFAKEELEGNMKKLAANQERLKNLKSDLEARQVALVAEKDTKSYLIDQTQSSESEYQGLLAQTKREQQAAASDIVNLERRLREKINSGEGGKVALKYNGFIWPVPSQVITAYFHDPSYPFKNIFQHPAIDIRAAQGTPIKAAASGYVGRAKDSGMGYSYIMLLHADNLATVYGHVSKIYVKEDQYVSQGEIIGLSGAMPGTPGAGPLTTGPHLHFEVRLNGIPVDPLGYLN